MWVTPPPPKKKTYIKKVKNELSINYRIHKFSEHCQVSKQYCHHLVLSAFLYKGKIFLSAESGCG
jgi:hypothetical protein